MRAASPTPRRAALRRAWIAPLVASAVLASGCAAMQAKSAFTRGQKAKDRGDYGEAIAAFETAANRDPNKPDYARAVTEARREAAEREAKSALEAEARGDYGAALKAWDRALGYDPDAEPLKARRTLAEVRTRQADPVEFYRAASRVAELLPGDQLAQKTLEEARREALGYHLRLASVYADAKAWPQAHAAVEVARGIDPRHPALETEKLKRVAARHHEATGDARLAAGDALGAYQAYEQSLALEKSAEVARKAAQAKRGAGSLIEQLSQADALERLGKWEDAADLYTAVRGRPGAPADLAARAGKARAESARLRADRARAFAERGLIDRAATELRGAIEHTDGPIDATRHLDVLAERLAAGQPAAARDALAQAKALLPTAPVVVAAPAILTAAVQRLFQEAKDRAARDPADALVVLRRLDPFAAQLAGFDATRTKLVKTAFGVLLERASAQAAGGQFEQGAELLATALAISQAPAALQTSLEAGGQALEQRDWAGARQAYLRAVETDGRSRLAKVGLELANAARLAELVRDAAEARVVEDQVRAASAYRAILEISPHDPTAQAGLAELRGQLVEKALEAARSHRDGGRLGAAFVYYRRLLDLEPGHGEAKAAADALLGSFGSAAEPPAWVAPSLRGNLLGDACPGVEKAARDRIALYLTRTPGLGARYLDRAETQAADTGETAPPPVVLRTAVESCQLGRADGSLIVTLQLLVAGEPVANARAQAAFDPGSVPKDELAAGLDPDRILNEVLGGAAKDVAMKVKDAAPKLAGWRAAEAKARLASGDAEAVARWWATMVVAKDLPEVDRRALRDLEQFLNNRFR